MKFFTLPSLKSDEEKLAEKERALALEQAEFQRRQQILSRRDAILNQIDESKAEFSRRCELLDKAFGYSDELFLRDFLNHGLTVEMSLNSRLPKCWNRACRR